MKNIIRIALVAVIGLLLYFLYSSLNSPIQFEKEKNKRYAETIKELLILKQAQKAYKDVNGVYSGNFDTLFQFVNTGKFPIVYERDTSYMKYDKNYRIERLYETTLRDTLRYISVKDSLFKNVDLEKSRYIPYSEPKKEFTLKSKMIGDSLVQYSVFQISASKKDVLTGLDKNLVKVEEKIKVPISGLDFRLGSLISQKENGNWNKDIENSAKEL